MIQLRKLLSLGSRWQVNLVFLSTLMIVVHLFLKARAYPALGNVQIQDIPLFFVIGGGGAPLLRGIFLKIIKKDFGADILAALALVSATLLGQYLAATLIILMLSSGKV